MDRGDATELRAFAERARAFLEPLWIDFLCDPWSAVRLPLSTGACRVSSEFLAAVMPAAGFVGWRVHGGADAFVTADGARRDHYWVSDGTLALDVTADQFGLPAIMVGPVDPSRHAAGPARPLSREAASEAGCIGEWVDAWRERAGAPVPSAMSSAAMDAYAGPKAAALALLLHDELDTPLYLARAPGRPPHPLVWNGSSAFDARGRMDAGECLEALGVHPDAFEPVDREALAAALGAGAGDAVRGATPFALAHPALEEALRQAFYARRDAEQAALGDDPGDDEIPWDAEEPSGPRP